MKRFVPLLVLLAIVLLIGGGTYTFVEQLLRQNANEREIAKIKIALYAAEERIERAYSHKEEEAKEHWKQAFFHLHNAQAASLKNGSGQDKLAAARDEIAQALLAIDLVWFYDDLGRVSEEHLQIDGKCIARTAFTYGGPNGELTETITTDIQGQLVAKESFHKGRVSLATSFYLGQASSTTTYNYGGTRGALSSAVTKNTDGKTISEEFFADGKLKLTRAYMGHCREEWKPFSVWLTVYDGSTRTRNPKARVMTQAWSLDDNGQVHLLANVKEFTKDETHEWVFGGVFVAKEEDDPNLAGKVPTELLIWDRQGTLVHEYLRADGSVHKAELFKAQGSDRKPWVKTYSDTTGGTRQIDPKLMKFPDQLINY